MRIADIVARAEKATTLDELRRAVVDWMLAQVQRDAERAADPLKERVRAALAASLNSRRR